MTNELPLKATLKSGAGYDAPWLTVDGADPEDLAFKLSALVEANVPVALIEAANALKAANNAAPLATGGQDPAPQQQQAPASNGWGNRPAQQQSAPAQQGARLHPEGKACRCGNVLNFKQVNRKSDGKQFSFWECPARTGSKDTQHDSEFAN